MSEFNDDVRRISVLVNDLGDGRDGDAWDRLRRLLEAAGAVDKNKCLIEFAGDYDVMRMSVQTYEQIYDYLAALPEVKK